MRIAIIGAGLAGLTAAHRLKQKGISLDLFEARNRVGGRVFSVLMKNSEGRLSVAELGGQSILDGGEAEHFFSLCEELGLEIETSKFSLASRIYHQGKYYDFDEELALFFRENPDSMRQMEEFSKNCESLQILIDKFFINYPALRIALISRMHAYEGLDPNLQSTYHNFETLQYMLEGGISKAHNTYEHKESEIIFKRVLGGNSKLPMALAKTLESNLHLNKQLTKIEKRNNQFHLYFSDKTDYLFDRVILATPASIYENIQLSENIEIHDRWEKMQSLHYGQNYKILIPVDIEEARKYALISKEYISIFAGSKDTLLVYGNTIIADVQKELEIISDAFNLKSINAKELVTATDENYACYNSPVVHFWGEDPYAKGSYSAYSTAVSEELDQHTVFAGEKFKTLFRPTKDGLFFAGEHTSILEYIGTMEGAIESGERVARACLQ